MMATRAVAIRGMEMFAAELPLPVEVEPDPEPVAVEPIEPPCVLDAMTAVPPVAESLASGRPGTTLVCMSN